MKDFIKRLTNLLAIKSLITIALVGVFCYLVTNQIEVPTVLTDVVMIVIGFYFGTQAVKDDK